VNGRCFGKTSARQFKQRFGRGRLRWGRRNFLAWAAASDRDGAPGANEHEKLTSAQRQWVSSATALRGPLTA
jgi:hypothetical protein